MSFQSTINFQYTTGFVGEMRRDAPSRVEPWRLDGQTSNPNTVGFAYTSSTEVAPVFGNPGTKVATVGGGGVFAGILIHPKHYALNGTSAGGPLAASMNLPPYTEVELMTMGNVIVNLPAAANYGDALYYTATGAITNVSTGNTAIPGATVLTTIAAAGPAVINLRG